MYSRPVSYLLGVLQYVCQEGPSVLCTGCQEVLNWWWYVAGNRDTAKICSSHQISCRHFHATKYKRVALVQRDVDRIFSPSFGSNPAFLLSNILPSSFSMFCYPPFEYSAGLFNIQPFYCPIFWRPPVPCSVLLMLNILLACSIFTFLLSHILPSSCSMFCPPPVEYSPDLLFNILRLTIQYSAVLLLKVPPSACSIFYQPSVQFSDQ